jgi:glycosyltransferase involved in cell wall biosynthesis
MTPELSCAVLSYRDEPFLVDAVRSVVDQDVPMEVVVVNSGGGDPGGRLAAAGLDVPVYSFPERRYPGSVRNVGIDATRARYVAFLAADCVAEPGWAAARLQAHRAGAAAVASPPTNAYPESTTAWASLLLLHNRRMAVNRPDQRLHYSLSYDRSLFQRFGRFREDLRAGEDTELNARLQAEVRIVLAADARTAHRYPTRTRAMLRDAFRRGRLQACAQGAIEGRGPRRFRVATRGPRNVLRSLVIVAHTAPPDRRRMLRAWPLVLAGGILYTVGALTTPKTAGATL